MEKKCHSLLWQKLLKMVILDLVTTVTKLFMMAINQFSIEQFFSGLYADSNLENEPMSGGRQMGGHFTTHSLNDDGSWKNLIDQKNSSADISPTAGQMPRLLGLAQASKFIET